MYKYIFPSSTSKILKKNIKKRIGNQEKANGKYKNKAVQGKKEEEEAKNMRKRQKKSHFKPMKNGSVDFSSASFRIDSAHSLSPQPCMCRSLLLQRPPTASFSNIKRG